MSQIVPKPLIPELPTPLIHLVVEYFDNYFEGAIMHANWDCATDYDDFQERYKKFKPRQDDDELWDGLEHCGPYYDLFYVPIADNVLAQLFASGMSFFPRTVALIAIQNKHFADWIASTFSLRLEEPIEIQMSKDPNFVSSDAKRFIDIVKQNIAKRNTDTTLKHTTLKRKRQN